MALKGNKGEWSEVYVLLKALSDGKLFAGDQNTNAINQLFYPIIKIIRDQSSETTEYCLNDNLIFINQNGIELCNLPLTDFADKAQYLLNAIRTGSKTFEVPAIEAFLSHIKCTDLKAKSSVKSDIRIMIHDLRTGETPELGFSIKSQLGGASTLLNAGKTTNFVYKINGLISNELVSSINGIVSKRKIKDRLQAISDSDLSLQFTSTEKSIFGNNLLLIDSLLPKIVSELLLLFYTGESSNISNLVNILEANNPLGFDQSSGHEFYAFKIKRLLTDIALGMMPSVVWTGEYDVSGGFLIVKEDGDILCYHIYHRNEFEAYLMANTKLETASSSRHGFGSIYGVGDEFFMNLNLQIRFVE